MKSRNNSSSLDWRTDAIAMSHEGRSWRKIAIELGIPRTTVSDYLRKYYRNLVNDNHHPSDTFQVRKKDSGKEDNSRILLISDQHAPFSHPDALDFLAHLKKKYNPTRVINVGDECDAHSLSYHEHNPDLFSAGDELKEAKKWISKLYEMFPEMDICESNHGSLVWRKAKTHGIPRHYIKSYNEVLEVGNGWKWSYELTITLPDGTKCYIHHGKISNLLRLSQSLGYHVVTGHFHELFGVNYWANSNGLYWAMSVGCLIDDESLAFEYNNMNLKRPIIGTGLIIDSMPVLEPMVLNKGGRWRGY